MLNEESYKKCLEEISKLRKTLAPQHQIFLDTATSLWKELDAQLNNCPSDGNALMAQTALSLLFTTFKIKSQSAAVVAVSTIIMNAMEKIAKIQALADFLEGKEGNAEITKTLQ